MMIRTQFAPTQLLTRVGYNRDQEISSRDTGDQNPIKQMMTLSPGHGSCPVAPAR